jgi:Flp pilus assembly protein TadG
MILKIKNYIHNQQGIAAIEFAMFVPLLLTLMLGMVDIGNALLAHKKVVTAAQIAGDLIAREVAVSDTEIDDAYAAAQMAIEPLDTTLFGLDVASVQYVGTSLIPTVQWRETYNTAENTQAATIAAGLGQENEGVLVITARYSFTPLFTRFFLGTKQMQEVAVIRGRRTSFVGRS